MFVIGTAGHIDHGKSAIITRLTGIDPDRLPEEKTRGMTIDIGFAHYDAPGGTRIGIIDVPGHERFVRNMIAGAGGIDAVMLVVAADDGWMPQSQEHLQITKLLGVSDGIVVISKIDLVEESWVDLVEDDIKEKIRGSFLENAPFVRLSSVTGEGFNRLKEEMISLAGRITERENIGKPRLYIDRSFVLSGMGGVVAGTLRGGTLRVGQDVAVFPNRRSGKVRIIQSHNRQIESASPGQRTSISLTGIDKEHLGRGGVITIPGLLRDYPDDNILALSVTVLPESRVALKDRRKLLMILGTTEVEGEIRLYGSDVIGPGENGIVFFRPKSQLFCFINDRFILRLPTPQVTVGGGAVLDLLTAIPRKKDHAKYAYLKERTSLTPEKLVITRLSKSLFADPNADFQWCNYSQDLISSTFDELAKKSLVERYGPRYYRPSDVAPITQQIESALKSYFESNPHVDGVGADLIASWVGQSVSGVEPMLQLMCERKQLVKKRNRFDLSGRAVTVTGEVKKVSEIIMKKLLEGGLSPPGLTEIVGDDKLGREALAYLVAAGRIVKVGGDLAFHEEVWKQALQVIREMFDEGDPLTVSGLREKLGSSRKYVVPLLEETDRRKITVRQGDIRVRGDNLEKK
ncbi:MAG: selenocysteine-specific translation elongation factor [Candidatus Zixiibacteriota bacterium]|nr:MAG: selenocysteine-specific translation elongation factor [candidate division Zixibacteria bacterium]